MILTVTLNAAIDKRYVVEGFRIGEVNRVKECTYVPGGKGLNVSKPAAIAGAEVMATGFVGAMRETILKLPLSPLASKARFIMWKGRAVPASISGMRETIPRRNSWNRDFA